MMKSEEDIEASKALVKLKRVRGKKIMFIKELNGTEVIGENLIKLLAKTERYIPSCYYLDSDRMKVVPVTSRNELEGYLAEIKGGRV